MSEYDLRRLESRLRENPQDEELQRLYFRAMRSKGQIKNSRFANLCREVELVPDEYARYEEFLAQYDTIPHTSNSRFEVIAKNGQIREITSVRNPTRSNTLTLPPFYYLEKYIDHESQLNQITLPTLPNLHTLDISYNRLGPEGVQNLQLPPNLNTLYTVGNQLGPDDIQKLQEKYPTVKING
jgi:hypothetical protein